jgi:hypothetical protein
MFKAAKPVAKPSIIRIGSQSCIGSRLVGPLVNLFSTVQPSDAITIASR